MPNNRSHSYHYRFPFAKYPAVRIAILLIGGILLSDYLNVENRMWVISLAFLLLIPVAAKLLSGHLFQFQLYHFSILCYLFSILILGAYLKSLQSIQSETFSKRFLDTLIWEETTFIGDVQDIRKTGSGNYRLDIVIDTTFSPENNLIKERYKMRATLKAERYAGQLAKIDPGSRVFFKATVFPLMVKRNPHEFDFKKYLLTQGIFVQAGIDTLYTVSEGTGLFSWNQLRKSALTLIDYNFSRETAPLAKALLIGYKNELSMEEKTAFSRAGLSHIMAVSGLHVGFILAPFWILIPFFWTYRYGRQAGLIILILILLYYAGLTGFTASVSRASITGGFIIYARLFNKMRDSINLTALAAIVIILTDPGAIYEIGFQLSFSAVYIILLTLPVLSRSLPSRLRYGRLGPLISIIMVSIVVQAGLFPILSYYFGEFSIIGPLANAFVVPFLGIILPYALLMLLITTFAPSAGFYLNLPNEYFLQGLNIFVGTLGAWEGSWIQVSSPGVLLFLIWGTAIFFISSLRIPKIRWKLMIMLLSFLTIHQSIFTVRHFQTPSLQITILDVGQGDAALIKTPLNKHILIDTGRWSPGYNSGRYTILPHLKAEGITGLDAVFLSHPHADHIGGIIELIQHIPIRTIYNSGFQYDSKLYKDYLSLARQKNIPVISLSSGTVIKPDPSMRILVYGPEAHADDRDPNERSLILELVYGSTEFLFMGDAGRQQEMRLLNNYGDLITTDFLKVGHHGSKTSSSKKFLLTAKPDISVVSLDKINKFRHPHKEAVSRLIETGTSLYYTGMEGALIFRSDGIMVKRIYWK